jgi:hypothetical protein
MPNHIPNHIQYVLTFLHVLTFLPGAALLVGSVITLYMLVRTRNKPTRNRWLFRIGNCLILVGLVLFISTTFIPGSPYYGSPFCDSCSVLPAFQVPPIVEHNPFVGQLKIDWWHLIKDHSTNFSVELTPKLTLKSDIQQTLGIGDNYDTFAVADLSASAFDID